jgi:hypothetical protein
VEEEEQDKKLGNRLLSMVNDFLEFKNSDSVYYSPLFGLPPPYFKHAKAFDTFDIVQSTMREMLSLDSYEQGYVPLALFKQVMLHELKIKSKIIDDFVEVCKQPAKSLDVNCTSNSLQSQIDFVVLIRKLLKVVEIKNHGEPNATLMLSMEQDQQVNIDKLNLSIDIESAMRLRNPINNLEPPNAFVKAKPPQLQQVHKPHDGNFQTNIVNQSCYPSW